MISVRLTDAELAVIQAATAAAGVGVSEFVRRCALAYRQDLKPSAWYITTDLFRRGGMAIRGPYSTDREAQVVREEIELSTGNLSYWIDRAPDTIVDVPSAALDVPICS